MDSVLRESLCCPWCSASFTVTEACPASGCEGAYAVLQCSCELYPVVAGIPVIRKGPLGAQGQTARMLSELILSGKQREALLALLMPRTPIEDLVPRWAAHLPSVPGRGLLMHLLGHDAIRRWTSTMTEFFSAGPEGKTAQDYLTVGLSAKAQQKNYHYFMHRFGQPRQLVALSLMTMLQGAAGPVLDFGCGIGLLTRHLPRRMGSYPVLGADLSFFRLYIAKTFLTHDVAYVCCDGKPSLPFRRAFFAAVYSSDTLFMVPDKVSCSRELQRVVHPEGLMIFAGLRNGLIDPEQYPVRMALPPSAYEDLFHSLPQRVRGNTEVLDRYLQKRGPALGQSSASQVLDHDPWFSLVVAGHEDWLVDQGPFDEWPHAEGMLELNPLYRPVGGPPNDRGAVLYRQTFPSSWYAQEDGDCRKYEPEQVWIAAEILRDLALGRRTPAMEELIARCVIVGVPERFHGHESVSPCHT
ncbi:MAG: class I SAM-dependent methyltransferase [Nitrospira sp.]|nr:class I SAM-dependent methyltransferase [Nitrospira sp.]